MCRITEIDHEPCDERKQNKETCEAFMVFVKFLCDCVGTVNNTSSYDDDDDGDDNTYSRLKDMKNM